MGLVTAKAQTSPLAEASALLFASHIYNVQIRRAASVFAVTALALDVTGTFQIVQRPLHRARREMQVAGYRLDARPAAPAACTIAEVHIDRSRPVRQVWIGVNFTEEVHFSP